MLHIPSYKSVTTYHYFHKYTPKTHHHFPVHRFQVGLFPVTWATTDNVIENNNRRSDC